MIGDPGDGALEPDAEVDHRGPAEHLSCQRVVGAQALDLASGRARPRLIREWLQLDVKDPGQAGDKLADGDLIPGAQVEDHTESRVDFGGANEAGNGVGDVGEVAPGSQVADLDVRPCEALADDRRDHRPGRLPRPVRVERAYGNRWKSVGLVEALNDLVCACLLYTSDA